MSDERPDEATAATREEAGPERLNTLCDGVVAIAMTVLALEVKMPEHGEAGLAVVLSDLMPTVMAFLLSFTVIAGFWLAHHRLMRQVRRTSRTFNLASIGFMLMLVSLNFPTAALARYGDGEPLAVVLYACVVAGTGLMLTAALGAAHLQDLYDPGCDVRLRRLAVLQAAWPAVVFVASLAIVPLSPLAAMLSWTLAALGGVVIRPRLRQVEAAIGPEVPHGRKPSSRSPS